MGKVFTPVAVEAGYVPEPGAHEAAGRLILESLSFPYKMTDGMQRERLGHVEGVMIYGSTALGTANIRSDVDVLFTYNLASTRPSHLYGQGVLQAVNEVFSEVESKYHTPIEPSPYAANTLSNTLLHTIDPGFALHLHAVQENPVWSVNWPVAGLYGGFGKTEVQDRLRPSVIRFLGHKQKRFARSIVDFRGEPDLDAMQRAFELPNAAGRKILSLDPADETGIRASTDKPGTLKTVAQRMGQLIEDWQGRGLGLLLQEGLVDNQFTRLVETDVEYTDVLQQAVQGQITIESYTQWLRKNYSTALARAHAVSSFWIEVLRNEYDLRNSEKELAELQAEEAEMRKRLKEGGDDDELGEFDY